MENRIIFIILCLVLLKHDKVFSQENRDALIKGYNSINEYLYFDSLNKLSRDELNCLNHSYYFHVAFKVDTEGLVIDFEIIEVPGAEIPDRVKIYIKKLVESTNGKWLPQVNNYKRVVSDEMILLVTLVKKDQSMESRMKDSEPIIEYFFGPGISNNEKLKKIDHADHKRYMILSY